MLSKLKSLQNLLTKPIPLIPPIFHNNEFVTDFKQKGKLFNSFCAKQCSLINNNSKLQINFTYMTEKRLDNVIFSIVEIANIIQILDPNKSQDKISIHMLKTCGNSVCKSIEIIKKNALT